MMISLAFTDELSVFEIPVTTAIEIPVEKSDPTPNEIETPDPSAGIKIDLTTESDAGDGVVALL